MQQVVVLNSNYQFLYLAKWKDAINLMYRGEDEGDKRAHVVATTEIELGNGDTLPKALRLQKLVRRRHGGSVRWSPYHLKIRDDMRCGYCQRVCREDELTVDHVVPVSKGGDTSWENTVAACWECNNRKGNRTPSEAKMPLSKNGKELCPPTVHEFFRKKVALMGIDSLIEEVGGWY